MKGSSTAWLGPLLIGATLAAAFIAAWFTRFDPSVAARVQAIASAAGLIGTACAAVFGALQLRSSAISDRNALATELPYLFVDPIVRLDGQDIVIHAQNHGRTVCTVSQRSVEVLDALPYRKTWLDDWRGKLCMIVVDPGGRVEAARIRPNPEARYIIGSLDYVNVFSGVQKSWYRFDLREDGWIQTGGMHWNPVGMGHVRHHDDTEPLRRKGRHPQG